MDENILTQAKFGDQFKTRSGKKAIYWTSCIFIRMITDDLEFSVDEYGVCYYPDRRSDLDIISVWEDEEK